MDANNIQASNINASDSSNLVFTLKGVTLTDVVEEKKMPKFIARSKNNRGGNAKIHTRIDYSGQRVRIAYTGNVTFDSNTQSYTCFWCHHPYDTPLICAPIKYIKKGDKYQFTGVNSYCSMFCLRAHLQEYEKYKTSQQPQWLDAAIQLAKVAFALMYPPEVQLRPAPHWSYLEDYSGTMDIHEFRKANCDKTYMLTPNIRFITAEVGHIVQ